MKTIWKFELDVIDEQFVRMPAGAVTLDVQVQDRVPCLWALVDTEAPMVKRHIITHGTGHNVSEHIGDHIATYQLASGSLVFHVFEYA